MKNIKFSILVPVYNKEKYLKRCLDSLINQTYKNIEIIVVNDGSNDNSEKIILDYKNRDNRIVLINHNENKSLLCARKTGIISSTGDFVLFVDSDDYLELRACEILSNYLIENIEKEVVQFSYFIEPKHLLRNYETDDLCLDTMTGKIAPMLFYKCYKREILSSALKKVNFVYMNMGEDTFINSLIMCDDLKIGKIDNVLYHYVKETGLTCTPQSIDNLKNTIKYLKRAFSTLETLYKSRYKGKISLLKIATSNVIYGVVCICEMPNQPKLNTIHSLALIDINFKTDYLKRYFIDRIDNKLGIKKHV